MATKNTGDIEIGGRLFNTATGNVVAGADAIKDEAKNRYQNDINSDVVRHESEIHGDNGINDRLDAIEAAESITYEGGSAQIAQASDFENPDATKRAKIPTVGAVLDGMNDGIYDVSKRFPSGGPNNDGKFTLQYILDNANTYILDSWKHGGMIISFVDSSDNKYVQFRYMSSSTSVADFTNVSNWQGVDNNPTAGSKNLAESGGVKELFDSQFGNSRLDFSVEDEEGNSIVSVNDGHVKTKKFDSSKSGQSYDARGEDFSVEDENKNSIVQFKDGHIRTKKFDSDKIIKEQTSVLDFEISDKNSSSVLVVKDGFPKTKNFNGKTVADNSSFSAGIINNNSSLYKTTIVNIADYNNNLVNVFNAISPSEKHHYTVLIPEGTYNVNEWFSQDTITNSNTTGWRGLQLPNYIKLLGIGASDKIILQWLNPDSATHYDYISTLNTSHWQELENLTIKANNIRYAVHDDDWDGKDRYVRCKNCNFIVSGNTTRAWGAGTNGGYDGVFDHCKFIMEYYAPFEERTVNNYINPMCLHDNYYNVGRNSYVLMRNCVFQNPYTNLMYYWAESWEQITRDNSYPQYDNNKLDYAINDCVNSPDDTEHSYRCIYANAQVPPCKKGRAGLSFGYGAEGANGVLYASIENCQFNTYFAASPKLERITGFGNYWEQEPILGRESDTSKSIIMDFRK